MNGKTHGLLGNGPEIVLQPWIKHIKGYTIYNNHKYQAVKQLVRN